MAELSKKDATWFTPVCDNILGKMLLWVLNYHKGDPSADRPFMNMNGRITDRITKYANVVRFTTNELEHLVRILDAVAPEDPLNTERMLVEHFSKVRKGVRKGKLIPGGEYEVVLDDYISDVEEVIAMLVRAKTGRLKSVSTIVNEQVESGKSPFEM